MEMTDYIEKIHPKGYTSSDFTITSAALSSLDFILSTMHIFSNILAWENIKVDEQNFARANAWVIIIAVIVHRVGMEIAFYQSRHRARA